MSENISVKEWQKLDLRVGRILEVEDIEGADKLYKLKVDIGSEKRILVAGLKKYYEKKELKGKLCIVFCNLEPKSLRGIESKGMILAASTENHEEVILISPEKDIEAGSRIS